MGQAPEGCPYHPWHMHCNRWDRCLFNPEVHEVRYAIASKTMEQSSDRSMVFCNIYLGLIHDAGEEGMSRSAGDDEDKGAVKYQLYLLLLISRYPCIH